MKLELLKAGLDILTSIGVGSIAGNALSMVKPTDAGKIKNLCIGIGSFVLTSMVCDAATDYVEAQVDDIAEKAKKIFNKDSNPEKAE